MTSPARRAGYLPEFTGRVPMPQRQTVFRPCPPGATPWRGRRSGMESAKCRFKPRRDGPMGWLSVSVVQWGKTNERKRRQGVRSDSTGARFEDPERPVPAVLCTDVRPGRLRLGGVVPEHVDLAGNHQRGRRAAHAQPEDGPRGAAIATRRRRPKGPGRDHRPVRTLGRRPGCGQCRAQREPDGRAGDRRPAAEGGADLGPLPGHARPGGTACQPGRSARLLAVFHRFVGRA